MKKIAQFRIKLLGAIKSEGIKETKRRKEGGDRERFKMWVSVIIRRHGFDPIIVSMLTKLFITRLQKKYNYGFIFIFDGMDNLTIDFVQRKFFRKWVKEYRETTDNNQHDFNAIYITAMRDYSFIDFYKEPEEPPLKNRIVNFKVVSYPVDQIIKGKCKLASQALYGSSSSDSEDNIYNILRNCLELILASLKFQTIKRWKNRSFIETFNDFNSLINDNFRAAMRFLRVVLRNSEQLFGANAFEILSRRIILPIAKKKIRRREWLIYRWLLMGDPDIRVFKNRTQYRKNLEFFGEPEEDDPILMTFNGISRAIIPNVFNYCDIEVGGNQKPEFPPLLFKLRTIQYLKNNNNHAMKFEIIEWYKEVFSYNYPNLRYMFREMIFEGLLNPKVDDEELIEYELSKRDYPVSASELSNIIYDIILKSC